MVRKIEQIDVKRSDGSGYFTASWCLALLAWLAFIIMLLAPQWYMAMSALVGASFSLLLVCLITGGIIRALWFIPGPDVKQKERAYSGAA